jgi:hypothetical protein
VIHPAHGPHNPSGPVPGRAPRSVRRTTSMDLIWPGGLGPDLYIQANARDLVTDASGDATVAADASLQATVDLLDERRVTSISTRPHEIPTDQLVGVRAASGFRAAARRALPDDSVERTPLNLLVDDIPVAVLISAYAFLMEDLPMPGSRGPRMYKPDQCSGWRSDGVMMTSLRDVGRPPMVTGPLAPSLENPDDPLGWHVMQVMPRLSGRRRRRMDLTYSDDALVVDAMFRDSFVHGDGREIVLHEYGLTATIAVPQMEILDCVAAPRVLPWVECSVAAASVTDLAGRPLSDVNKFVKTEFYGVSTCTHLNDLLRSLCDITALAKLVPRS